MKNEITKQQAIDLLVEDTLKLLDDENFKPFAEKILRSGVTGFENMDKGELEYVLKHKGIKCEVEDDVFEGEKVLADYIINQEEVRGDIPFEIK